MILSAQRVRASSGLEAINCYHYSQSLDELDSPVERFYHPGTLVWRHRPLPQAGNRVRSFLDVAAPEEVTSEQLLDALRKLVELEDMPQAFSPQGSGVAFKLYMEPQLLPEWRREALSLLYHLLEVHP